MQANESNGTQPRLLFLLSRFLDGGIDTVLVEYLRHLSQRGCYRLTLAIATDMGELEVFRNRVPHDVRVVHLVSSPALTRLPQRKIRRKLPLPLKLWNEIALQPVRRSIIGRELKRLAREHDVVIDFDCCHYSYLRSVGCRKVAWFHFSFDKLMEQNPRRMKRIGRRLGEYDRVVCISQAMLAEGERLFPLLKGKLCLVYNAKDPASLMERASEEVADERIRQPYIIAVERLEESQKDLSTLLRAYQLLRTRHGHTERLYIVGKGRSEQQLRALAKELAVDETVDFLGFSSNPLPWIYRSRMVVHSAKFEGLPTVMIEALQLGKLIVASDCPTGPAEILAHGDAGVLTPVGDAEAMAAAMHRLLTDGELQEQIKEGMRKQQYLFSFEATDRQFDRLVKPQ
ncbi:MAG: glycosyltransferase [Prevotella sp.]|nr:glycosyltransferase [Prevotella sp.]